MMVLTEQEIKNYLDPYVHADLSDLWSGIGSYKNRKIESYGEFGWYKVYRGIQHTSSYALINTYPDRVKKFQKK